MVGTGMDMAGMEIVIEDPGVEAGRWLVGVEGLNEGIRANG